MRLRGLRRCRRTRRSRHCRGSGDRGLFGRIRLFNQLIGDVVLVDVAHISHGFLAYPRCCHPLDIVEPQIRVKPFRLRFAPQPPDCAWPHVVRGQRKQVAVLLVSLASLVDPGLTSIFPTLNPISPRNGISRMRPESIRRTLTLTDQSIQLPKCLQTLADPVRIVILSAGEKANKATSQRQQRNNGHFSASPRKWRLRRERAIIARPYFAFFLFADR